MRIRHYLLLLILTPFAACPARAEEARLLKEGGGALAVGRVRVAVRDLPGALRWLDTVLGWKPSYQEERLAIVPAGPVNIVLDATPADAPATIVIVSEDVDADHQRLLARGAVSLDAPADKPYGLREAYLQGPGALRFELEGPLAGPTTGFVYTELRSGTGPLPRETDTVKVHFVGTLSDGTVFDSHLRGRPAMYPLKIVIPCWAQGLQKMRVGGKARLTCPPSSAYGLKGRPPKIPPNAVLHFDVELLGIAE